MVEKFQTPKGTRDFLPEEAIKFQKLIDLFRIIAEKYGFEPIITPAFENFDLLSAKGGLGESVKDEIYYFKDKSDRELGLRFDMTMPLARVISSNPQLPKPFKRYVVDKVWRYDNPQAMRFREFYQADIDIIGSYFLLADAECLAVVCEFLDKLGFKDYSIKVNSRRLVEKLLEKNVKKGKIQDGLRILDKLDKKGFEWIKLELLKISESEEKINKIIEFIQTRGNNWEIIRDKNAQEEYRLDDTSIFDLKELYEKCKELGIDKKIQFDASLVRGLEYYTGVVFEVSLGAKVSCGGGGRYDNLIELLGNQSLPATGISLGLSRIFEVMKEENMFDLSNTTTKIFVANVNEKVKKDAIKIAQKLRSSGINCQIDLMNRKLTKQLEFADRLGISYVIVVGEKELIDKEELLEEKELMQKKFKLKDMRKKTEKELSLDQIIKSLK